MEYLGIGIEECKDRTCHTLQKRLITKSIETTKMTDCKPNWTPTIQVALASGPDGEPYNQAKGLWNYASVVGMLLHVSNNTPPDITFAVSQVAHFTAAPKVLHAKAIKSIIRYLAHDPSNKGLIIKPDGKFDLKCWVDADFAGLYGCEPIHNPKSLLKSRYMDIL